MEKIERALKYLIEEKYVSPHDLMYSTKLPFNLEPFEYQKLKIRINEKLHSENGDFFEKLNLIFFDKKPLFFADYSKELITLLQIYANLVEDDFKQSQNIVFIKKLPDILDSRIYSEIEGTLSIESVNTTRKKISEIVSGKRKPSEQNDFIVKNMINAFNFVLSKPTFNKDNLFNLYKHLSEDCLEEDYQLQPGNYYRHDEVEVDGYAGCPASKIDDCMNSLIEFVNYVLQSKDYGLKFYLPHIAHYYILYIHPYFDYNGRTARMVSFWLILLTNFIVAPFASEAIDQNKNLYYEALRNTRDADNDLTYFLIYILKVTISSYNCYQNIEEMDNNLKNDGVVLTNNEKIYLKKIMMSTKGYFLYSDFIKWIKTDISKQGALKILNAFVDYDILITKSSKSNQKLFSLNEIKLKFKINIFD